MTCKNCGAEISDYSVFCTFCGKPIGNQPVDLSKHDKTEAASAPPPGYSEPIPQDGREPFQQPEFGQVPDYDRSTTTWQNNYSGYIPGAAQGAFTQSNGRTWREIRTANVIIDETGRGYGIAWLKFIVYFQLFAAALLHLINAIQYLSGSLYGVDSEYIYRVFPGLHALDITMGVLSLLLCGATVFARFAMTGLRRFAPWLYLGLLTCNVVVSLLYLAIASAISGLSMGDLLSVRDVTQMVAGIGLIAANFVYFRHRMSAFVN